MAATLRNVLSRRLAFKTNYFGISDVLCANEPLQHIRNLSRINFSSLSQLHHRRQRRNLSVNCNLHNTFSVSKSKYCEYSTNADRNCWKCGVSTRSYEELFFCKCGIVQELPDNLTYFEMLNANQEFDIDTERLSKIYKDLQSRLHPDKFTLKSQTEQDLAVKQSAFINKAYFTLLKPLSRGLYLLELWGDPLEESTSTLDQEFLMEMMEVNEDVDEARSDLKALELLEDINNVRMGECVKKVSKHFQKNEISEAKLSLIRLKYFTNISDKIKEIHRDSM